MHIWVATFGEYRWPANTIQDIKLHNVSRARRWCSRIDYLSRMYYAGGLDWKPRCNKPHLMS